MVRIIWHQLTPPSFSRRHALCLSQPTFFPVLLPPCPIFFCSYLPHGPTCPRVIGSTYLPPGLSSSVPTFLMVLPFPPYSVLTSTCPTSFLVLPVLPTSTSPVFFRSNLPRCPTCLSSRSYLSSHLPSPTISLRYLLFLTSSRSYLSHLLLYSTTFPSYFPPGSTCPAFFSVLPPTCPTFVRVLPSSCSSFSILHFPFLPSSALSFTQLFFAFAFADLLFLEHFLHSSLAELQLILQITASMWTHRGLSSLLH